MDKDKMLGCSLFLGLCAIIYKTGYKAGQQRMLDMIDVWEKAAEKFGKVEPTE
jgi:hypothetical protein